MQVVSKNGKTMGVRQPGRYYDTETVKEMRKAGYSVREVKDPEEKKRRKPKDGSNNYCGDDDVRPFPAYATRDVVIPRRTGIA